MDLEKLTNHEKGKIKKKHKKKKYNNFNDGFRKTKTTPYKRQKTKINFDD